MERQEQQQTAGAAANRTLTGETDEALVIGALLGNVRAFDALVRRFRGAATLTARQALGPCASLAAAEDVAQEALLIAFKALPQLTDPAKFAPWLRAITRRRALRRLAANRQRITREGAELSDVDRLLLCVSEELQKGPEASLLRREEAAQVQAALEKLPDDLRTVMALRYAEEWPLARIASFLSLPLTTVKWRLHQGRTEMRRRLNPLREEYVKCTKQKKAASR